MKNRDGFTLIELLVVIGVLSILATAVILSLQPAELLRQARDSSRLSELRSIKQAISLASVLNPNLFVGTSTYVYLSLPDNDGNGLCNEYPNLPPLVSPWQYACAAPSNFRKVDGVGWIPINFTSLPIVPLETLPVDPVNSADSRCLYYRYAPGLELDAKMESNKYKYKGTQDVESVDGGDELTIYETGFNLGTAPAGSCLVKMVAAGGEMLSLWNNYEIYTEWAIPGSGNVKVTKLWFFREATPNPNPLSLGESIELAIYDGVYPNYTKIPGGSVIINGDNGGSSWLSADLPSPITITLGQTYVFGIGPAIGTTHRVSGDTDPYNANYPPANKGSYLLPNDDGSLDNSISILFTSNTKYGSVRISYAP